MLTNSVCCTGAAFAPIIGKPYEGKPHVRFDEGVVETGYGRPSETPFNRKGRETDMVNLRTWRHRSTLQIRNSLRYISWKERKTIAKDLKLIYKAATEKEGSAALDDFAEKWDKRYPHVSASWKKNWAELSTFFKYPPEIRTLIYTTNLIESLNRKIRKVAKNKSSFPNEQSLFKLVYLAVEETSRKWTMRHRDWAMIYSQLMIFFKDRLAKYV